MVPRRCWLVFGFGALEGCVCGGGAGRAPAGGVGSWPSSVGAIAPVPARMPAKRRRFTRPFEFDSFFMAFFHSLANYPDSELLSSKPDLNPGTGKHTSFIGDDRVR
jgi:hypothetical protein